MEQLFTIFGNDLMPDYDYSPYIRMIIETKYKYKNKYDLTKRGILVSRYSIINKLNNRLVIDLRIDGVCIIRNPEGVNIESPDLLLEYYRRGKINELHFDSIPHMRLTNASKPSEDVSNRAFFRIIDAEHHIISTLI